VAAIYLAIVFQAWPTFRAQRLLLWSSVFVFEVLALFWYTWQMETYNNVRYVEHVLRSRVREIVTHDAFWDYEYFQAGDRGERFIWWEWTHCAHPLIAIVVASVVARRFWSCWDALLLASTAILYLVILWFALKTMRLRQRMLLAERERLKP
jgi:hypothetical protein